MVAEKTRWIQLLYAGIYNKDLYLSYIDDKTVILTLDKDKCLKFDNINDCYFIMSYLFGVAKLFSIKYPSEINSNTERVHSPQFAEYLKPRVMSQIRSEDSLLATRIEHGPSSYIHNFSKELVKNRNFMNNWNLTKKRLSDLNLIYEQYSRKSLVR